MRFIFILLVIFSEYSNAISLDKSKFENRVQSLEQQRDFDEYLRAQDEVVERFRSLHSY